MKKMTGLLILGAVAIGGLITATFQSGGIRNFHGQEVISFNKEAQDPYDLGALEPAAGHDDQAPFGVRESEACGNFIHWIGEKVDEDVLKQTDRPYRILPPGAIITQDFNPERINVHVDDTGTVEDVVCG